MDTDGDGYLDLFVCNYVQYKLSQDLWCSRFEGHKSYCGPNLYKPERSILYHNNRDGTFTDVSAKAGISKKEGNGLAVIWLDADEDGKPDIFVANDQSPNHLWRNNGDGTFSERAEEMGLAFGEQGNAQAGMGVDTGDYDNDGHLDLLLTTFSEEPRALYHHEGGGFRDASYSSGVGAATVMYLGFGTAFIDYDRDGWLRPVLCERPRPGRHREVLRRADMGTVEPALSQPRQRHFRGDLQGNRNRRGQARLGAARRLAISLTTAIPTSS